MRWTSCRLRELGTACPFSSSIPFLRFPSLRHSRTCRPLPSTDLLSCRHSTAPRPDRFFRPLYSRASLSRICPGSNRPLLLRCLCCGSNLRVRPCSIRAWPRLSRHLWGPEFAARKWAATRPERGSKILPTYGLSCFTSKVFGRQFSAGRHVPGGLRWRIQSLAE